MTRHLRWRRNYRRRGSCGRDRRRAGSGRRLGGLSLAPEGFPRRFDRRGDHVRDHFGGAAPRGGWEFRRKQGRPAIRRIPWGCTGWACRDDACPSRCSCLCSGNRDALALAAVDGDDSILESPRSRGPWQDRAVLRMGTCQLVAGHDRPGALFLAGYSDRFLPGISAFHSHRGSACGAIRSRRASRRSRSGPVS